MAEWFLEPGHTAAEFCVRHMMVTYVRGHFKNVQGKIVFDPARPRESSAEVRIDARSLWTGEPDRDAHLRGADFLDVDRFGEILFKGERVEQMGGHDFLVTGPLTLRGVTRPVTLAVQYLGQWSTPWWEGNVDKGPKIRAGFVGKTSINRHDFGVSWNAALDHGGIVVGNTVEITVDAEAILIQP